MNRISEVSHAALRDGTRLRILVCGATGTVGSALCAHLSALGHDVIRGMRKPESARDMAMDFSTDTTVEHWLPRVRGMHVVINAVGIIVESKTNRFDALHHLAPVALFRACAAAGVGRVIQISALGAPTSTTPYFRSKHAADEVLRGLPVPWQILYPSLIYAEDGDSATLFRNLASLPAIPVPGLGDAQFQPVHIDDIAAAVVAAIDPATPPRQSLELVGTSRLSYAAMLAAYRRGMQFGPAAWITIPGAMMSLAARVAGHIPGSTLTPDNWRMLQAGSHGDMTAITQWLGRPPLAIERFIPQADADGLRQRALATWRAPLLRVVLAIVWLATALITLFAYPLDRSMAMLEAVGLHGAYATAALYGAIAVDAALGVASLLWPGRKLWAAQAALIVGYSVIIAAALPEFLWHPFGPLLKNLPILAILVILYAEQPSWNTSSSR